MLTRKALSQVIRPQRFYQISPLSRPLSSMRNVIFPPPKTSLLSFRANKPSLRGRYKKWGNTVGILRKTRAADSRQYCCEEMFCYWKVFYPESFCTWKVFSLYSFNYLGSPGKLLNLESFFYIWKFSVLGKFLYLESYLIFVIFSPPIQFLAQFFSTQKRVNRANTDFAKTA